MTSPTAQAMLRPIETDRFILRPLGLWEAYRLTCRHWLKDPEIMNGTAPNKTGLTPLRWFFAMERPNKRTKFTHAIEDRATGKIIGLNQTRCSTGFSANMSIAIHDREYWGNGVVLETRRALINALFQAGQIDRIEGNVDARNHPSVFNYRALGFTHVGTLHRVTQNRETGERSDFLLMELLREDWEQK